MIRSFVALAIFLFVAASANIADFNTFLAHHGKQYSSPQEFAQRLENFQTNLKRVKHHNELAAKGVYSFTLAMNHLADMSDAEYREAMLSYRPLTGATRFGKAYTPLDAGAVPASYDWRSVPNVVAPVKNQGQCGSCWSFSAVATMEGASNHKTGKLQTFSEQQLVDCAENGTFTCTVGGEMFAGIDYVSKAGGIEAEDAYPYTGQSLGKCNFDKSKAIATFSGYTNLTSGDETSLQSAAYTQPIVSVAIDASSFWFQLYFGGVFDISGCKNNVEGLDHGVAVVGYDHDATSGKDYWIVRNSWGPSWGKSGYIWMVRNKNNACGIATQACFANL